MTVREAAALAGVTPQAIYKRLQSAEKPLDTLRNKDTKQLTADGIAVLAAIYPALAAPDESDLSAQVTELTKQVTELNNSVIKLTAQVEALTSERDHLRQVLDHEQQLHAALLAKLPALPADTSETRKKTHWWERLRK